METMIMADDASIQKMFGRYVEGFGGKPRHSRAATLEVGNFDAFLDGACQGNVKLHNALFDRMMGCAVEFEESGFVAGVRYALQFLTSSVQTAPSQATSYTPVAGESPHRATQDSQAQSWSITTKQMAEMFETSNGKIVKRIEDKIFPFLDAQSRGCFTKEVGYTPQHRKQTYYRLNRAACEIYMKAMEPHKKYVNIAGGLAKMEELMQTVFQK